MSETPDARSIAVVGGGPAGLMAADVLASAGHRVTIYDRMPTIGRKLLMAGRGGLNLTHAEALETFLTRYGHAAAWLAPIIHHLPPQSVRDWADGLGAESFVGSSGRVFPKAMKASPLLRAWLGRLGARGVEVRTRHRWTGIATDGGLRFETPTGATEVRADAVILALGGASWPRLGSDGSFAEILTRDGIAIAPLKPANMGFAVAWSDIFRQRFAGHPLKRIRISHDGISVRGEAMITAKGIEGGAIYALADRLRDTASSGAGTRVLIDLRPDMAVLELIERLGQARAKESLSNRLRKSGGLSPVAIGLLRERATPLPSTDPTALAALIKAVPLDLGAPFGLDRAISTAGGVMREELDGHLMLSKRPGVFLAGEMLDWEAPTGGYLLQACFATGGAAAEGAMAWVAKQAPSE